MLVLLKKCSILRECKSTIYLMELFAISLIKLENKFLNHNRFIHIISFNFSTTTSTSSFVLYLLKEKRTVI